MKTSALIILATTVILFALIVTLQGSSSFSITAHYPLHKSEINITSNTTILVYVNDWAVNNTKLSFTGKLYQDPGGQGVGNATLNITWNGSYVGYAKTLLSNDTVLNGTFNYTSPSPLNERAGLYELNVSFSGATINGAPLNPSYNKTGIRVRHPVVISAVICPEGVVVGENISVSGVLKDDDGFELGNESLHLCIDADTVDTTATLPNGNFSFNYSVPLNASAGNHSVYVFHPDSDYYTACESAEHNITIKRTTYFSLTNKSVGKYMNAEINGALFDNMNVPLACENVSIYWQNATGNYPIGSARTNETGFFAIEHYVEELQGSTVNVTAVFNGSGYYEGCFANATYTVLRGTFIVMEEKRVARNCFVEINGIVLNDENNPMANCNISLYWNGTPINITKTNAAGEFSYSYFINQTHSLGNVSVRALFEQNVTCAGSETTVNYTIYAETATQMNSKNLTRGEFADIAGRLVDDIGEGVEGTVEILWNNRSISNITSGNNGNFSFRYQVPWNHSLGWVNITAKFAVTDIYNESLGTTQYLIYSKTNISMSGMQIFRNTTVVISGSIEDDLYARVLDLNLEIYWHNNTGKYLLNVTKSNTTGYFSVSHAIPRNHSLGSLNVSAVFNGTEIYAESVSSVIYTVVSNTTIILEPKEKLFKYSEIEIVGFLLDDMGTNIENHTVFIYWNNISIGTANSTSAGFILPYFISENQSVGAAGVRALFLGSDIYIRSENNTTYYVHSNTTLNVTLFSEIVIDEDATFQIQLFENCTGMPSTPVPNGYICIGINNLSLGIGITNADGMLNFTVRMSLNVPLGLNALTAMFNGGLYYEPAYYEVPVAVKQRANLILNIPNTAEEEKEIKCTLALMPKSHNLPIEIKFTLVDSIGNVSIVIGVGEGKITLFPDANNTAVVKLLTDFQGNVTFSVITSFVGLMKIDAEFKGGEYITEAKASGDVYVYKKKVEAKFQWLYLLFIPIFSTPLAGYYIMRKYQIAKMRKIIQKAKGELIAGTEYIKTILVLYRKLCTHLKKFGFLRKEFETFREFETAVRSALPIDAQSLDKFITLIEEVRYSTHEIGEEHRKKAIDNFSAVEESIKKLESGRK